MDFQRRRVQFASFIVGIVVLSITAEKCRQLIGEDHSSQSGKFTILNCFDMGSGTLACGVKEGVKLYVNNLRSAHIEAARVSATESALADAYSQGLTANEAAKVAQKAGAKAAKETKRKAKRIVGPIISSGWDFFEALYYGGGMGEGFLRGFGTLIGTYGGGFLGDQRLGRVGYLVGSQLGSWGGGRIGLMVYDVISGIHYLVQFGVPESSESGKTPVCGMAEESDDAYKNEVAETPVYESVEASDDSYKSEAAETPVYGTVEASDDSYGNEAPAYTSESSEASSSESYETYEQSDYPHSEL